MATPAQWWEGARPRTLPAAIAPVLAGTGLGVLERHGSLNVLNAVLALALALVLQVGVNYSNDYSDGVRGTDATRVGPVRLVGQGLAAPGAVKGTALLCFGVAALLGLGLTVLTGAWWLVLVGAAAIASAWLYTGGPRPYGYAGLGEVFVFVFFGLVATMGSAYLQSLVLSWAGLVAAIGVGTLTCAILVANNLRDIPGDTVSGKNTLAVRLGDARTRVLYVVFVAIAWLVVLVLVPLTSPWALLGLLAVPVCLPPLRAVRSGAMGRDLIPVLAGTGRALLVYGLLLGVGLAIAGVLARS